MEQGRIQQVEFRKEQVWWILLPLVMAVVVAVLFPWIEKRREQAEQERCAENMETVGLWMVSYATDHGGTLPTGPDWVEELGEYIEDHDPLICPAAAEDASVSYAPNPDLSDVDFNLLKNPHDVVLLYEGDTGTVVNRHHGGANYLFADRFVEWREEPPPGLNVVVAEEQ